MAPSRPLHTTRDRTQQLASMSAENRNRLGKVQSTSTSIHHWSLRTTRAPTSTLQWATPTSLAELPTYKPNNQIITDALKVSQPSTSCIGLNNNSCYSQYDHIICDWNRHVGESRGPLRAKSPKGLKKVFLASRPGVSRKSRQRTRKESKRLAGRPGKTLLRLLGDFGPRGRGDSCIWGLQS